MKKKRILALILSVAMLLLVTACNNGTVSDTTDSPSTEKSDSVQTEAPTAEPEFVNKEGLPIINEVTTFTAVAQRTATTADWNDMWCFKKIEEVTNIAFDIDCINEEAWTEKINLIFAAQTLPEVFFTGTGTITQFDLINYGSQGLLLPLEGYLDEYGPVITQLFEKYSDVKKCLISPDGHIYDLRGFNIFKRELSLKRFWVNTQWIENLGMTIPTNTDEFYDVMMAFKDNDANGNGDPNDEIPVAGMYSSAQSNELPLEGLGNTYQSMDIPLLVAFGYVNPRIDTLDGTVVYVPTEEHYQDYLKYFNMLYESDLVDPDYFSQTKEQFLAKGAQGIYGTICHSADWLVVTDEAGYSQYSSIPPLVSEYNDVQMWPGRATSLVGGMAVTMECEHPETMIRLIDWLFTEEGSLVAQFGPENGTWDEGDGGWELTTEDGKEAYIITLPEGFTSYNVFRQQELTPMKLPHVSTADEQPLIERYVALMPTQTKLTNDIMDNFFPYLREAFPNVMMTAEENDEINAIQTDLEPYVKQMESRFMTGEESFDNYGAFVQGCKDRGSERLAEILQQVYDRWLSSN